MCSADQLRWWNKANLSLGLNKCSFEDAVLILKPSATHQLILWNVSTHLVLTKCWCVKNIVTDITLCLEIWITFKEASSALGGKFAVLYILSSETLWLLEKDIGSLKGDSFWHSRCWLYSFSLCNIVGTTPHFKKVRGTGLFWLISSNCNAAFLLLYLMWFPCVNCGSHKC